MKKIISIAIISLCTALPLIGQGILNREWTDGDPLFTSYTTHHGVVIDSTVRLIPVSAVQTADSFKFILYGEDGIWPIQKFPISAAQDVEFISENKNYYLITDGFGRRVFEINYSDPQNPISAGFSFVGDKLPLVNPVDASIFYENNNRKVLITDNGGHRIIKVDRLGGDEEWAYGDGTSGIGKNQLSGPADAIYLENNAHILICDQGNSRVIEVDPANNNEIVWSYGGIGQLNPVDIEYDETSNQVLITDQKNHRVMLVNKETDGAISWQFGNGAPGKTNTQLNSPTDADLLANGNILIADAGNNRLIEVNKDGQVIWTFQHRELINLRDVDRLPDNRTIIVADYPPLLQNIPIWLGYSDSLFTSPPQSIGKKVNFDSLHWEADLPSNTRIKIQLRSADNLADLEAAQWYGPSSSDSFYVNMTSAVDRSRHMAHSFFQFRAYFETSDPLNTPVLNQLSLRYHYYDDQQPGIITSEVIRDSSDMIVTNWTSLSFHITQSEARNIKVSIINPTTGAILNDFFVTGVGDIQQNEPLSIWNQLKGVQAFQLRTTLQTNNTATTPVLDNWQVKWNSTVSTPSKIEFVDEEDTPVDYYRVSATYPPTEKEVNQVGVRLEDQNLATVQDTVTVRVRSAMSEDEIDMVLERIPAPSGVFLSKRSIPTVIFNFSIPGNSFLEVFNRDTLYVSYTDPTNPSDKSQNHALIVENTRGKIDVVNSKGFSIDTVAVRDTIYISVTEENDQNITPAQDTIFVDVFDNVTSDVENVMLLEIPDSNDVYYTGNFISNQNLIVLASSTGTPNDGILQSLPGNQIGARYVDNVTIQDLIYVERGAAPLPLDSLQGTPERPLDFDVAPNPFYTSRYPALKLRASSTLGNLYVHKIEIYNLAGQKVRTLRGDQIQFDFSQPIPQNTFAYTDTWWDLRNDGNDPVSSGTYWIKMYGSFIDSKGTVSNELSYIKKLVIIR